MAESDFGFRRMHVHVYLLWVAFQEEESERVRRSGHQVVISRREGMQQQPVANQPAIDENENRIPIALLHLRAREEASEAKSAYRRLVRFAAILGDSLGWR